jgi:hypothetical protein
MVGWPREVRIWSRGARSGELGQRWCALLADHGPTRGAGHGTGHISSTLSRGGAWTSPPSSASIYDDGVSEVKVELGGEASRYGRQWQAGSCFAAQTSRLHRRGIPTSGDGGGASGSLPFDLSLPACPYGLLRLRCAEQRQSHALGDEQLLHCPIFVFPLASPPALPVGFLQQFMAVVHMCGRG